jgi:hypothetical protein
MYQLIRSPGIRPFNREFIAESSWNVSSGVKKLLIFACAILESIQGTAHGQTIGTIAGGGRPGSVATAYAAPATNSVAVDASGNLYVAVTGLNQVWVVSATARLRKSLEAVRAASMSLARLTCPPQ